MLWILASLFFLWCAFREVRASMVAPRGFNVPRPIYRSYLVIVLVLSAAFGWPPIHKWHFERILSAKATVLAEHQRAIVHCNTVFDTMVDPEMLAAGHANPRTGEIDIQHPWCDRLSSYLDHPQRATELELWSLNILTHESMHIRGELNEAVTECEAVQRNYRTAKILGVPDRIARQNALDYYNILYKGRAQGGFMQQEYYSDQCAPGRSLDEHLPDSTWATEESANAAVR
jgi:hypothetical protein